MTSAPQGKPQPIKLRQVGDAVISRLNKRESPIEIDVLPDTPGQVITYLEIYRAVEREAKTLSESAYQPTKDRAPKGWKVKDVDPSLVRFNTDGSVTFLIELKYRQGDYW